MKLAIIDDGNKVWIARDFDLDKADFSDKFPPPAVGAKVLAAISELIDIDGQLFNSGIFVDPDGVYKPYYPTGGK